MLMLIALAAALQQHFLGCVWLIVTKKSQEINWDIPRPAATMEWVSCCVEISDWSFRLMDLKWSYIYELALSAVPMN